MTFKGLYSRWGRQTCKQINEIKCYKTILEVHYGKKSLSPNSTCMTCDCVFSVIQLVYILTHSVGFPGGSDSKEFTCNMGDLGSEGPWVGKIPLEKGMATYSNILDWRIPWTEEPGGLQFLGLQRVRHDWAPNIHMVVAYLSFFNTWLKPSVQFSHSVVSDSLRPHEPEHAMPTCSSPTPRLHPNSYPLSRWCHPTISSFVVLFSSCPQSFPAAVSFQMSQLFASCGQSIGVSASTSVLSMNTQDWSPLGWTGWIPLQSKGLSRVLSNTIVQKHQFSGA